MQFRAAVPIHPQAITYGEWAVGHGRDPIAVGAARRLEGNLALKRKLIRPTRPGGSSSARPETQSAAVKAIANSTDQEIRFVVFIIRLRERPPRFAGLSHALLQSTPAFLGSQSFRRTGVPISHGISTLTFRSADNVYPTHSACARLRRHEN